VTQDQIIRELLEISGLVGGDILLAQGGGGNTSVKSDDGDRMWIKASGVRLSELKQGHGYIETNPRIMTEALRDQRLSTLSRTDAQLEMTQRTQAATRDASSMRPSIESGFHALLGRAVVHTHPVYVNAFSCMQGGEQALADVVGEPVVWVHYAPPGYALAVKVDVECAAFEKQNGQAPVEIVLANHGMIAAAASGSDAIAATFRLVDAGKSYFGRLPSDALAHRQPPEYLTTWAQGLVAAFKRRSARAVAARATTRTTLFNAADEPDKWLTNGPFVPDDVVYGTHQVWEVSASVSPQVWLDREFDTLTDKMIVVIPGLGVVLAAPNQRTLDFMEEYLLARVLTRRLIARRGHPSVLSSNDTGYLEEMESEQYRQSVAATVAPEEH